MKFFSKASDGGKDSGVTGFFLFEIKPLFSIVLLHFRNGTREAYHSHGLSVAEFWQKFPEAYKRATENAQDAAIVIPNFVKWVQCYDIPYPVVAAWKPGFDIAFLRYYLYRFVGGDIFGRGGSGLDIKTLAAIASGQSFSNTRIGELNQFKAPDLTNHTHDALDDAIEQAHVLFFARRHLRSAL